MARRQRHAASMRSRRKLRRGQGAVARPKSTYSSVALKSYQRAGYMLFGKCRFALQNCKVCRSGGLFMTAR